MTKWLTALFILFILGIIIAANQGANWELFYIIRTLPYGDKIGHFGLMGLLAFLVNLSLQGRAVNLWGRSVLLGSLLVVIFVTLEELSQAFIATRTLSFMDWTADMLGIWLFGRLAAWLSRKTSGEMAATSSKTTAVGS